MTDQYSLCIGHGPDSGETGRPKDKENKILHKHLSPNYLVHPKFRLTWCQIHVTNTKNFALAANPLYACEISSSDHPDDGGSTLLWNVDLLQQDYMTLHPRRLSYLHCMYIHILMFRSYGFLIFRLLNSTVLTSELISAQCDGIIMMNNM
jgi:hypothetical protein